MFAWVPILKIFPSVAYQLAPPQALILSLSGDPDENNPVALLSSFIHTEI